MVLGSGIRDPGSGKNLFRIPDPGVKKHPIPDPDPQHCILVWFGRDAPEKSVAGLRESLFLVLLQNLQKD